MTNSFQEVEKNLNHVMKELDYLNHHEVVIGFFGDQDSEVLTIVRANEYGAHIVPKNSSGKLWIPYKEAIKEYGNSVKPKDIKGLFVAKTKKSAGLNVDGKYVVYFYLLDKVTIPARPFIRKAFAQNQKKYQRYIKAGIDKIVYEGDTGKSLLNRLGRLGVADIRESMRMWTKPGNAPLTIDNKKGANNPLIDTGHLVKGVTYRVIPTGG